MKLSKAIIETAKEWASLIKAAICYVAKKENLKFTAQILWLILPVPIVFCILSVYINASFHIPLFGVWIVVFSLWVLFWMGVYTNMDVTASYHYDETQKKWVTDYKEETKEEQKRRRG